MYYCLGAEGPNLAPKVKLCFAVYGRLDGSSQVYIHLIINTYFTQKQIGIITNWHTTSQMKMSEAD